MGGYFFFPRVGVGVEVGKSGSCSLGSRVGVGVSVAGTGGAVVGEGVKVGDGSDTGATAAKALAA